MHLSKLLPLLLLPLAVASPLRAQDEQALATPPDSHVLDLGKIYTAAQTSAISYSLTNTAKNDGVQVFLVTVPMVSGTGTNRQQRIEALANKLAADWTVSVIGGVVLFDDETGLVSIATSKKTDDRFTSGELNMLMEQQMKNALTGGVMTRDNLQRTTLVVADAIQTLQARWTAQLRRRAVAVGLIALVIISISTYCFKRRSPSAQDPDGGGGEELH